MYSFRYHLVTICSILVALALGLLLGAAISSSDLARTTSNEMVDSMLSRYETLTETNAELEDQLQNSASLSTALTREWAQERLGGRTIVIMRGNSSEDRMLASSLSGAIRYAGGSVVSITVQRQDFGLDDEAISAALHEVVEEVPDEEYQLTLARRLTEEWSYHYTTSSIMPTQEDYDIAPYDYQQQPSVTADEPSLEDSDSSFEPQTAFQSLLSERYQLTRILLSERVLSIEVDYSYLQEHADPAPTDEQLAVFSIATAWQLPYGVNGFVNAFASMQGDVAQQTQMGIQLAICMQEAAEDNQLTYPAWLKSMLLRTTSGDVARPNYHVLLVQPNSSSFAMDTIAENTTLSCVTTPSTESGRYSVLALLSGSEAGIYGEDRPPGYRFAPLPQDPTGKAVFR